MKRVLSSALLILILFSLSSCGKKINNQFFTESTLLEYGLNSDFPNPIDSASSLVGDENLYVYLSDDEYRTYVEEVYNYLKNGGYYYVGTYEFGGLIAEMVPYYVYTEINDTYDFSESAHSFIYSTKEELHDAVGIAPSIDPCYKIEIERVEETKYNVFSKKTYNTVIRISEFISAHVENMNQ